jgi:hypothetical protein
MGDYVYAAFRAALFIFATYTVITVGFELAGAALFGNIGRTLLDTIELLPLIYIVNDNKPPWLEKKETKRIVAMDDSL